MSRFEFTVRFYDQQFFRRYIPKRMVDTPFFKESGTR